jgi:hypothetical protein
MGQEVHVKRSAKVLASALLAAAALPAPAQEKKDGILSATYKVEFRIRDGSDAAAKDGRRYTMLIDTTGQGTFRVGDRVPVVTGSFQQGVGGSGVSPLVNTQFSYFDTGVNIDTRLIEQQQGKVTINATIDVSTIVTHKPDTSGAVPGPASLQPTVSQIKIGVNATVSPGKASHVASIDDPVSQRKFDVEAVVTKVE